MNLALHGVFLQVFVLILGIQNGFWLCSAGEPGYLDFDNLPDTNFSCQGKVIGGYYADVETGCQMFHVCTIGQKDEIMDIKFLCLNGTVFDQETRVCERVDEVDCSKSERFYNLNLELYGNHAVTLSLHENSEEEDEFSESLDDPPQRTTSSRPSTTTTTTTTTLRPIVSKSSSTSSSGGFQHPNAYPQHYQPQSQFPQVHTSQSKSLYDDKNGGYHHQYIFHSGERNDNQATSYQLFSNQGVSSTTVQSPQVHQVRYTSSSSPQIIHDQPSTVTPLFHATSSTIQTLLNNNGNNPALINPIFHNHGIASTTEQYSVHSNNPRETSEYRTNEENEGNVRPLEAVQSTNQGKVSKLTISPVPKKDSTRTTQGDSGSNSQQHRGSSNFLPTPSNIETTIRSFYPTPRTSSKPSSAASSSTSSNNGQGTQHIHVPPPVSIPHLKPQQITINLPPPDIQRIVQNPSPLLPSQSRVIVTAKASVSDESGRPLNTSQIVTLPVSKIPSSYDDYKEGDVSFDPFYRDVPKIRNNRKKRSSTDSRNRFLSESSIESVPSNDNENKTNPSFWNRMMDNGKLESIGDMLQRFKNIFFSDDESISEVPDVVGSKQIVFDDPYNVSNSSIRDKRLGEIVETKLDQETEIAVGLETKASRRMELDQSRNNSDTVHDNENHATASDDNKPPAESEKLQEEKDLQPEEVQRPIVKSSRRRVSRKNGRRNQNVQDTEDSGKNINSELFREQESQTSKDIGTRAISEHTGDKRLTRKSEAKNLSLNTKEQTIEKEISDVVAIAVNKEKSEKELRGEIGDGSSKIDNDNSEDSEKGSEDSSTMEYDEKFVMKSTKSSRRVEMIGKAEEEEEEEDESQSSSTEVIPNMSVQAEDSSRRRSSIVPLREYLAELVGTDDDSEEFPTHRRSKKKRKRIEYEDDDDDYDEYEDFNRKSKTFRRRKNPRRKYESTEEDDREEFDYTEVSREVFSRRRHRFDDEDDEEGYRRFKGNPRLIPTKKSSRRKYESEEDVSDTDSLPERFSMEIHSKRKHISSEDVSSTEMSYTSEENSRSSSTERYSKRPESIEDVSIIKFHETEEELDESIETTPRRKSSRRKQEEDVEEDLGRYSSDKQLRRKQGRYGESEKRPKGSSRSSIKNPRRKQNSSKHAPHLEQVRELIWNIKFPHVEEEKDEQESKRHSIKDSVPNDASKEESSNLNEASLVSTSSTEYPTESEEVTDSSEIPEIDRSTLKSLEDSTEGILKFTDELSKPPKEGTKMEQEDSVSFDDSIQDYVDDNYEPENYKQQESQMSKSESVDEKENVMKDAPKDEKENSTESGMDLTTGLTTEMITEIITTTEIPITRSVTPKLFKPISARKNYNYIPPSTTPNPVIIKPRPSLIHPKPAKPPKSYNDVAPKPVIRKSPLLARKAAPPDTMSTTTSTTTEKHLDSDDLETTSPTITSPESNKSEENVLESKFETTTNIEETVTELVEKDIADVKDSELIHENRTYEYNSTNNEDEDGILQSSSMRNEENFTPYPLIKFSTLLPTEQTTDISEIPEVPDSTTIPSNMDDTDDTIIEEMPEQKDEVESPELGKNITSDSTRMEPEEDEVSKNVPEDKITTETVSEVLPHSDDSLHEEHKEDLPSTTEETKLLENPENINNPYTSVPHADRPIEESTTSLPVTSEQETETIPMTTLVPITYQMISEQSKSVSPPTQFNQGETTMMPNRESSESTPTMTTKHIKIEHQSMRKKIYSAKRPITFNCLEKEMYRFYGDSRDCRLFHYCSPGFTSRQVLDFRFVCEEGTAFDEETQSCRHDVNKECRNRRW